MRPVTRIAMLHGPNYFRQIAINNCTEGAAHHLWAMRIASRVGSGFKLYNTKLYAVRTSCCLKLQIKTVYNINAV